MRLYNTLSRTTETFTPGSGNSVRIYTCGLTVYARGHIGNFRSFVCADLLRRTLRYLLGYQVRQVVNFTDIDDRTIAGAASAGMELRAYTEQFITAFHEDARKIGLEEAEESPRATDPANLKAMADMIAALDRNGLTYRADGSVYFRISGMPRYGALAHLDLEGMKAGATVEAGTLTKEDVRDFVLWKGARPGEPAWDLVDPPGRPGWHLECSAMALRLLGEPPIDIHTGGIDLIFPHHENEIAQSEGATGKPFSRFWMHIEHLLVDDQKMSKSLGNTYTISDILERGFRVSALRYLLLSSHYRKQLNFTWSGLAEKEESLRRLMDCLARVDRVTAEGSHEQVATFVDDARRQFSEAMQDDLNTAAALAAMFDLVRAVNSAIDADHFGRGDAATVRSAFDGFDRVLGILTLRREEDEQPPIPVVEIDRRIEERNAARRRRDFSAADRIRDELAAQGIILEDSAAGTRWKRK